MVFSKLVRFQPGEQNMSKEAKKEVVVCDGKDKDNTNEFVYIRSVYQGGDVDGHFLKFKNDGTLTSIAAEKDRSIIKLQAFEGDHKDELWLITDPNQAGRALKSNFKDAGTSSFTVEQKSGLVKAVKSYNEVTTNEDFKPFVFKKKKTKKNHAGSPYYYLYSYKTTSNGESLVLAVDEDGELRMKSPPEIHEVELLMKDDSKYLFRILEV